MPQELVLDFDIEVSEGSQGFVESLQLLGSFNITVIADPKDFSIIMKHDGPRECRDMSDSLGDLSSNICIQVDMLNSCGGTHSQSMSNIVPHLKVAGVFVRNLTLPVQPWSKRALKDLGFVTANDTVRMRVHVRGELDDLRKWPVLCQSDLLRKMWLDRGREDFYIEACGGEEVKCHRSVVASASDVFDKMLHSGCQEGWMPFIKVHDSVEEVSMLLEFLYTGELPLDISSPMLLSLLRLADFYQVPTLAKVCAKRIGPLLSESNVVQVFQALQPLRHVNKAYDDIYRSMMEHVRDNRYRNLLEVLCMSSMAVEEDITRSMTKHCVGQLPKGQGAGKSKGKGKDKGGKSNTKKGTGKDKTKASGDGKAKGKAKGKGKDFNNDHQSGKGKAKSKGKGKDSKGGKSGSKGGKAKGGASTGEQATQLTMKFEKDLAVGARDPSASEEQKGSSGGSQNTSLQRSGAVTSGIAETLASNESRSSGYLADAMPAASASFGATFHASQSSQSVSQSRPAPAEAAKSKRRTRRGGSKKTKRAQGQAAQSTMSVPGTHNSFED